MEKAQFVLKVEGMSCGGCVRSVGRIISRGLGLEDEQVEVDLESGRAEIAGKVDVDQIDGLLVKLEEQGFPSQVL